MITVTVTAKAFDARTYDSGCTAKHTCDDDLTDNSRWPCSSKLVQAARGVAGNECQVVCYGWAEAQSVASVSDTLETTGRARALLKPTASRSR